MPDARQFLASLAAGVEGTRELLAPAVLITSYVNHETVSDRPVFQRDLVNRLLHRGLSLLGDCP